MNGEPRFTQPDNGRASNSTAPQQVDETARETAPQGIDGILKRLPQFRDAAAAMQEIILANLVMIGEAPAPIGEEEKRVQLILQRLSECGLQNCSSDEKGNGYGVLFGEEGAQNILISTNADTYVSDVVDQTIEVGQDRLVGPFVGDNCLALAVMVSLPTLFEKLQIRLKSNLVFMAAVKSLGRGNLEGLKYFLANSSLLDPCRALPGGGSTGPIELFVSGDVPRRD